MLYVSTRNYNDSYTAHRAFREKNTPDGGFFVPMRLPAFSKEELTVMKNQSFCQTVAQVLNYFSGLQIRAWDVECALGRCPVKLQPVHQKITIAELWRNPENDFRYLLRSLYALLLGDDSAEASPEGWSRIAIEIAVLFGVYSIVDLSDEQSVDVAVSEDDASAMTAVLFAKKIGLNVNLMICACHDNSVLWNLVNSGELSARCEQPQYFECLLHGLFGQDAVLRHIEACEQNGSISVDEEQAETLKNSLYTAVISQERVDTIIAGMYGTNQYRIDGVSAQAYGGLQDYRAQAGIIKDTLLLSKQRAK